MGREIIKLSNSQWNDLAHEDYLEIDGKEVDIEIVKKGYTGSSRHTEHHFKIFKVLSTNKYFRINYETSVKDSMGWSECNYGNTYAEEVFPKEVVTIVYE